MTYSLAHRTAPHRTAPHRTAPHRTAPHRTAPHQKYLKLRPLIAALLASFPLFTPQFSIAAEPSGSPAASTPATDKNPSLPDLGASPQQRNATFSAGPNGARLENTFGRQKVVITPEYSNQTGLSIGAALASMLGDNAAVGVLLTAGADKKEWLLNAGY